MNKVQIQIILSLSAVAVFIMCKIVSSRFVSARGEKYDFSKTRITYVNNLLSIFWLVLLLVLLGVIWEITLKGLSVYFASFFAIAGIALFASWSILSNITAAVILFFAFPIKVGYRIIIQDGDNSIEGKIVNISLFNIKIEQENGDIVYCPNNVALQKPIIHKTKT